MNFHLEEEEEGRKEKREGREEGAEGEREVRKRNEKKKGQITSILLKTFSLAPSVF